MSVLIIPNKTHTSFQCLNEMTEDEQVFSLCDERLEYAEIIHQQG